MPFALSGRQGYRAVAAPRRCRQGQARCRSSRATLDGTVGARRDGR